MQTANGQRSDWPQGIRAQDTQESYVFQVGNNVWLSSKGTSKHKSGKTLPKFVGFLLILKVEDTDTYLIEQNGWGSRESESWLAVFYKTASNAGKAPLTEELNRESTRQCIVIGKKFWQAKMLNLRNWLDECLAVQRNSVLIALDNGVSQTAVDLDTPLEATRKTVCGTHWRGKINSTIVKRQWVTSLYCHRVGTS